MADLDTSVADMSSALNDLRAVVDQINNPKDLTRRWQLIAVVDGVHEPYAPSEGWVAGRLLSELREWLEEHDGDTCVHFEIHPAKEGSDD